MEEYRPNSDRAREAEQKDDSPEQEKRVQQVAGGRTRKKNELSKLADTFISKDVASVKNYVLSDVLVPAVKKAVSDIVTNGIDMLLYGEASTKQGGRSGISSKVSYTGFYNKKRDYVDAPRRQAGSAYSYDEVVFDTRGEAESVLMSMDELIDMYGTASVADLYDLAGVSGNFTDNKYGWVDLRSAAPVRVRDGYVLKLPRAMPLD